MRLLITTPCLLVVSLSAQATTSIAPAGYDQRPGYSIGNQIPWWSGSGVYMQVHDATDLQWVFPTPVPLLKALSFRKPADTSTCLARSLDAQVTLGVTVVDAQHASTTFKDNLGPTPTVVTPYTRLSLPALTQIATPNPQGWFFPFTTPFRYGIANGNLCYELRFKNVSTVGGGTSDAVAGTVATFEPMLGIGCTVTGQTTPAAITTRSMWLASGFLYHRLERGPVSAVAALFLGTTRQRIVIPGLCGALEALPILAYQGVTTPAGTLTMSLYDGWDRSWWPDITIYAQFVFRDPNLPYGVGVSDCSPVRMPSPHIARIWAGGKDSGQGNEIATVGARDGAPYGLVTGFVH